MLSTERLSDQMGSTRLPPRLARPAPQASRAPPAHCASRCSTWF
jgi:hypothetical protein